MKDRKENLIKMNRASVVCGETGNVSIYMYLDALRPGEKKQDHRRNNGKMFTSFINITKQRFEEIQHSKDKKHEKRESTPRHIIDYSKKNLISKEKRHIM